jgi:hypothetical protein
VDAGWPANRWQGMARSVDLPTACGFFDQPHASIRTAARQIDEAIVAAAATDSTAAAGIVTSS